MDSNKIRKKHTLNENAMVVMGLIFIITRFATQFFFTSMAAFFVICGVENIVTKSNVLSAGILNMPYYYYSASALLAIGITGLAFFTVSTIKKDAIENTTNEQTDDKSDNTTNGPAGAGAAR